MAGNKRLTKELADLGNDPIEGCHVAPKEDDIYHWEAMCDGPVRILCVHIVLLLSK
jgi:ubiquitin-protein ligase